MLSIEYSYIRLPLYSYMSAQADNCSDDLIREITSAPTSTSDATIIINCDINLREEHVVKQQLLFLGPEASG